MLCQQRSGIREEAFNTATTHTLDFDAVWLGCTVGKRWCFWALAADTYALDLGIKVTLQKDVSLIKLSVTPPLLFCSRTNVVLSSNCAF